MNKTELSDVIRHIAQGFTHQGIIGLDHIKREESERTIGDYHSISRALTLGTTLFVRAIGLASFVWGIDCIHHGDVMGPVLMYFGAGIYSLESCSIGLNNYLDAQTNRNARKNK